MNVNKSKHLGPHILFRKYEMMTGSSMPAVPGNQVVTHNEFILRKQRSLNA